MMQKVLDLVDKGEAARLLKDLVRAPSVNPPGDTTAVVQAIGGYLDGVGIPWEVLAAEPVVTNLVARLPGKRPGKMLILNGHIDVVPAGENWTHEPFGAEEVGERIYGRGACDMKAGIAAMLLAMAALKRSGEEFAGEVLLMAVADEETGGALGTRYLLEQGVGKGAAYAIVGEPSNLQVELGNRGVAWLEITVSGRAGHPGRPVHGANAVHYAGRLISAIANMRFDLRNDLFEVQSPSVTVTMVHGGVKANIIPERCVLTVDRRLLPGETAAGAIAEIEQVIAGIHEDGVSAKVNCLEASEPYLVSRDEHVVQALVEAHRRVVGGESSFGAKGGATDGSYLYHLAGVPTVLYGPGDASLAHTADEYVDLTSVTQAARVYALAALDLLREGV
ncbi:MAG: M20 family metallopeptidase [Chloroflexota bacterium]